MKSADKPANPIEINGFGQYAPEAHTGLTKREMFAMHAMSSWIIHHGSANNYGFSEEDCAIASIACADALLAELEK
jgi:hypothetical protein